MAIDLDLRSWPLVFTRFDGSQSIEEVDGYFGRTAAIHARKEPWVSVSFMNGYTRDPRVLRRMAEWMKKTEQPIREYCVATAMVAPSAGFRFMLGTVLLIQPIFCPYTVCANLEDALAFVRQKARERALTLPEARPSWG
jgi:hypothetical protein